MALPKSNDRKLQLSPTDSAFLHNCNMFGCYCLYLGPLAKFVLQTDIENKEITGFFVSLQNPFLPLVTSSHGLSSHFSFLYAF